jgi:hypothetical protein
MVLVVCAFTTPDNNTHAGNTNLNALFMITDFIFCF